MPKSPEAMGEEKESKTLSEAEERTRNIKELEKAGAKVLSESEKSEKREKLRQQLREFEDRAHKLFEKYGSVDEAIGQALIEMGWS